ncbi:DUF7059 domain-containing protein, partial [Nocardiopsis alba]
MSETEFPRALADRLRGILIDADYTVSGVRDRLGDAAAKALAREQLVPALRATGGEERLGLLLRLWWLRSPIPLRAAAAILPVDELVRTGLVTVDEGPEGPVVRALVHLGPWELEDDRPGFVVSDPKV